MWRNKKKKQKKDYFNFLIYVYVALIFSVMSHFSFGSRQRPFLLCKGSPNLCHGYGWSIRSQSPRLKIKKKISFYLRDNKNVILTKFFRDSKSQHYCTSIFDFSIAYNSETMLFSAYVGEAKIRLGGGVCTFIQIFHLFVYNFHNKCTPLKTHFGFPNIVKNANNQVMV